LISSTLFVVLVALAATSDVNHRKVPNTINFSLLFSGVALSALGCIDQAGSPLSISDSLMGIFASFLILLVPFAFHIYRGGDVKLCIGMGAWLGLKGSLWAIALGVIGGGVFGLGVLIQRMIKLRGRQAVGDEAELTTIKTIPMAVSFAIMGVVIHTLGAPPWS
jgi:Flp pilus assembly protein protease CpaA